ncbi:hypothetical protein SLEP1_g26528 [Rubroshorea leprosula]|uniref:Uncharacterized protein n=1 Tax=Rubroshorea leprosula TaxID=152421 RepID=A0AAV5JQ76_9ROSI|nr:hypothetical protein SLEP1_g26528 [Rubroshorea leprosula]
MNLRILTTNQKAPRSKNKETGNVLGFFGKGWREDLEEKERQPEFPLLVSSHFISFAANYCDFDITTPTLLHGVKAGETRNLP